MADTKARLVRFFQHHNPSKLADVDKVLTAYAGREADLFAALVQKYGPEPPAAADTTTPARPTAPPQASPAGDATRQRLTRFFQHHNPEKLSSIDKVLEAYAGRERELFAALVEKYGPEPSEESPQAATSPRGNTSATPQSNSTESSNDTRSRLVRFFQHYNPDNVANVDKVLQAYAGRDAELFAALTKKYGPEPAAPAAAPAAAEAPTEATAANTTDSTEASQSDSPRVLRPEEKDPAVRLKDFIVAKRVDLESCYFAAFADDRQMLAYTRKRYGDYENRLRRLFVRYCPEKLEAIKSLLDAEQGREEQLMRRLVAQLGPEPPRSAPTKLITLTSRKKAARIEDEEWSDDEAKRKPVDALVDLPPEILDAHRLLDEAENAPPGEYSGDEGKCYPQDDEHWVRLRFDTVEADADAAMQRNRQRAFTEFVGGGGEDDDEGYGAMDDPTSPKTDAFLSPRSEGGDDNSPRSDDELDETSNMLAPVPIVHVASKRGITSGSMCLSCSSIVQRAFDALWTPVGPRHRQMVNSVSAVRDGFLEKLSGGRKGKKWHRRFFRVNDKGMHYYDTNNKGEKPKGHKVFTAQSVVIGDVDTTVFKRCRDPHFHYFVVTVNYNNEEFIMRTTTKADKEAWVAFLKDALDRLRVTLVGQDPNPARWRARVDGLKAACDKLTEDCAHSSTLHSQLQARRDKLVALVDAARFEAELSDMQCRELDDQKIVLQRSIADAARKIAMVEDACELRTITAAEDTGRIAWQREELRKELARAQAHIASLQSELKQLNCTIIDLENAKATDELRYRKVYERWRRCEERSPSASVQRAQSGRGLVYRPNTSPDRVGKSISRSPPRKKYSETLAEKAAAEAAASEPAAAAPPADDAAEQPEHRAADEAASAAQPPPAHAEQQFASDGDAARSSALAGTDASPAAESGDAAAAGGSTGTEAQVSP